MALGFQHIPWPGNLCPFEQVPLATELLPLEVLKQGAEILAKLNSCHIKKPHTVCWH